MIVSNIDLVYIVLIIKIVLACLTYFSYTMLLNALASSKKQISKGWALLYEVRHCMRQDTTC